MKRKVLGYFLNGFLLAIILAVTIVGFYNGEASPVTVGSENVYYSGESENGVSLNFNIYERADNVYKILNILDEHQMKATFFLGGSWADDNIDCVREIHKRGHEIGSHGYFHKDHTNMTYKQNKDEIAPSIKLIEMILQNKVKLFAPPSGAYGDNTISVCADLGLKVVMWSKDTIDWRDSDTSVLIERATTNLKGGDFVLFHPKDWTVEALPQILTYITKNNLQTITVSQNLGE